MRLLLSLACFLSVSACTQADTVKVQFRDGTGKIHGSFKAEIAANNASREIGLMYRKELAEDEAMLFIFPVEAERSFWMKNTYIELDIIFLDSEKRVVSIAERAVPLSETPRKSLGKAQYVLEIRGGLGKSLDIRSGMKLEIEGQIPEGKYD